jgi:Flp pilus assembly protein TadG
MKQHCRILANCSGAAAVEMALVTPLLLIILCGSIEVGNYFMNEHTLLAGVRDGARYAARQSFSQYNGCGAGSTAVPTALSNNTKLVVQKGTLDATAADLLPNWTDASATFTVTMSCVTTAGGVTMSGIYNGNSVGTAGVAPAVQVTASLPYRPLLASFGWRGTGYFLNASQQAAVAGI